MYYVIDLTLIVTYITRNLSNTCRAHLHVESFGNLINQTADRKSDHLQSPPPISIYLSFYFYRLGCNVRTRFGTYALFPTCNLLHALLSVSLNLKKFSSINSSLPNIRDKVLGVSHAFDKSFIFLAIAFYKQLPIGIIYSNWWYKNKSVVLI